MRVWLDGQCLQTRSAMRGIGRYVLDWIGGVAETCPDVELVVSLNAAMPDEAIAARARLAAWVKPENLHVWQGAAEGGCAVYGQTARRRLSEIALAHHVACLDVDVALQTSAFEGAEDAAAPLLEAHGHGFAVAAICYDFIPYRFAERYLAAPRRRRHYMRQLEALRRAPLLLAISDFSAAEARALCPGADVAVINAALSPDLDDPHTDAAEDTGLDGPYVLYVGALDWRKNVAAVARAFALLPAALRETVAFAIAGDATPDQRGAIEDAWRAGGLPAGHLRFLGHVSNAALIGLYRRARLVVQPSLMEGFGLTALEAIACGAPTIVANAGALPEVSGDEAALFDPASPASLAAKMQAVLSDPAFAARIVERSRRQLEKYSWAETARASVAALRRLAGQARPRGGIEAARDVTQRQVAALNLNADLVAEILACAEPAAQTPGALYIDVTSTCLHDHGTGIQRVVREVAGALNGADKARLIFADAADGFYQAEIAPGGAPRFAGKAPARAIGFGPRDTVVMLDSSWAQAEAHAPLLREARLRGARVVACVYDLVPLKTPAFCGPSMPAMFSAWFRAALAQSDALVCISRAVAEEARAMLAAIGHPSPMRIGHWPLGADAPPTAPAAAGAAPGGAYFLMVGTIEPRKGYDVALAAFEGLWRAGANARLCIAGKIGWGTEQFVARLRNHPEFGARLLWIERPDDKTLKALYGECEALIAASHAEGFGLPIIEAGAHAKPVIASDIPAFREAARETGAIFFEAGSAAALAAAVRDFAPDRAPPPPRGVTWAQSAEALHALVTDWRFQSLYTPGALPAGRRRTPEGELAMTAPLDEPGKACALDLVSGGDLAEDGGMRYIVRVRNCSDAAWASAGAEGRHGVFLGYAVHDEAGRTLAAKPGAARIPLALPAWEAAHLSVTVPGHWRRRGGRAVRLQMNQAGVGAFGPALVARLA